MRMFGPSLVCHLRKVGELLVWFSDRAKGLGHRIVKAWKKRDFWGRHKMS